MYDYSEGEVLHSWKQLPIEGIFELRIKFMKLRELCRETCQSRRERCFSFEQIPFVYIRDGQLLNNETWKGIR